ALTFADSALVAMACYAVADGLLSRRDEHQNRVIKRLSILTGSDTAGERRLRKMIERLYRLRSDMAHGRRPDLIDVQRFLLREPRDGDSLSDGEVEELREALKWAAFEVLRAVYGAFVWLAVRPEEPGQPGSPATSGWSKSRILDTLDQIANAEKDREEVRTLVPRWFLDPAVQIAP
ncbi:MAG: hypothetical protein O6913_06510, partial [Chloroflexi bacterium]|nr:hypothetical protein [Chloroflexota bacterium]